MSQRMSAQKIVTLTKKETVVTLVKKIFYVEF